MPEEGPYHLVHSQAAIRRAEERTQEETAAQFGGGAEGKEIVHLRAELATLKRQVAEHEKTFNQMRGEGGIEVRLPLIILTGNQNSLRGGGSGSDARLQCIGIVNGAGAYYDTDGTILTPFP